MPDTASALKELAKLDYDAIEAYETAIEKLEDEDSRRQLQEFCEDHRRHTRELGELLTRMGEEAPTGPDAKRLLTEGKVVIAGLGGDKAVLRAMNMNEKVTNESYEKALKLDGLSGEASELLRRNLADEQRHKAWIEQRIEALKDS